jgi:hypothetical protein
MTGAFGGCLLLAQLYAGDQLAPAAGGCTHSSILLASNWCLKATRQQHSISISFTAVICIAFIASPAMRVCFLEYFCLPQNTEFDVMAVVTG